MLDQAPFPAEGSGLLGSHMVGPVKSGCCSGPNQGGTVMFVLETMLFNSHVVTVIYTVS